MAPKADPGHDRGPRSATERIMAEENPTNEEIDLASLSDEDLTAQMHDDLYDGLADEIVDGTNIPPRPGLGCRPCTERRSGRGHADRRH